jgi:tetratricopeptide (TPR) repeat protein
VLAKWADAARQSGRITDAAAALEEAIASFRERGDVPGVARAMTLLANVLYQLGDARGKQVAREAVALLEPLGPGPDLVAAYAETGRQNVLSGETREGIAWAERALVLSAQLGLEEPAKALGYRGLARTWMGDAGGLDDMRRAFALAVERGEGREAAVIQNNIATMSWPIEGPTALLAAGQRLVEFAAARGIAELALKWSNVDALVELGRWDEAASEGAGVAEQLEASGAVSDLLNIRQGRVLLEALRGEIDEALPMVDWLVDTARATGSPEAVVTSHYAATLALAGGGDRERARSLLDEIERTPGVRQTPQWAPYLSGMVRTALAAGDTQLAERLASGLDPVYPYRAHALVATAAMLAEARGNASEAADLHADAAERWERFGVVTERAFALLGQGRCLVALGRAEDAAAPLRTARGLFAAMGAQPSLAETDALLQRTAALAS